jgi:hypothetical protein
MATWTDDERRFHAALLAIHPEMIVAYDLAVASDKAAAVVV